MEKLKMSTPDLTDKNVEQIGMLFPNVITEVEDGTTKETKGHEIKKYKKVVDFDLLRQMLSKNLVEDDNERYRLDWPGKKASLLKANTPITKTLRPCLKDSSGKDGTPGKFDSENLYIEGDNFEVLKILQESYLGKIKMIYIDPPYNTGNDFIYKDNFAKSKDEYEEELGTTDEDGGKLFRNTDSNGRYHSDWLSMMYERLVVARDLLKDDGVITIHIDENEYPNLEKILSEVFGEENNLGTIVWDKRNPKGDATGVAQQHELISIYCKNKDFFKDNVEFRRPKENAETMLNKVRELIVSDGGVTENVRIKYKTWLKKQDFSGGDKAYCLIDDNGDVYRPVSMAWPNKKKAPDDYFIPLIHPITKKKCPIPERGWRNPSSTMNQLLKDNLILFGNDETTQPNRKYLLKENLYENVSSLIYYGGSDDDLLKELGVWFDTPKVVDVSKKLISPICKDNDIILDFFSGSATTAHAVMQLNAEELAEEFTTKDTKSTKNEDENLSDVSSVSWLKKGKRKFIMVQLPEPCDPNSEAFKAGYKTIAEIGKERIRRAGKKILEEATTKNTKGTKKENNENSMFDLDKSSESLSNVSSVSWLKNLDIGFRVYKTDSTNMKDVFYHPNELKQDFLDKLESNIKEDRTPEDLLTQVVLDLGLELTLPIETKQILGNTVFIVQTNALVACFDKDIDFNIVDTISDLKPLKVVFKDASFKDDKDRINVEERFKRLSPETKVTVI